jgi:hypothetical protein
MADYAAVYEPGTTQTYVASAAITGRQLLQVTGNGTVAPTASTVADVVGVAANDAATGALVTVISLPGVRHELLAVGAVTAGQVVEAATAGGVAAGATNPVGIAITGGTSVPIEVLGT